MAAGKLGVLICGKIRDEAEFRSGIETYMRWRNSGLIDKIVFSGWSSDLEPHRDCIDDAVSAGVEVILTPEPETLIRGHIFHQKKTLHYGLSRFADDDVILRTRTDKAQLHLNLADMMNRYEALPAVAKGSPFTRRVLILRGLAFHPYFYNDMLYTGTARDLRLFANYDFWFELQNCVINAEQAHYVSPIIAGSDDVRDYFMVNPGLIHHDAELAMNVELTMVRDPFYRSILRKHLLNLLDNYGIGFQDMGEWRAPTEDLTLEAVIQLRDQIRIDGLGYTAGANSIEFARREAIEYLLNIPVSNREHRSLRQLADTEQFAGSKTIMQPAAAKLADALAEVYPFMGKPAPLHLNGITAYQPRRTLIIG